MKEGIRIFGGVNSTGYVAPAGKMSRAESMDAIPMIKGGVKHVDSFEKHTMSPSDIKNMGAEGAGYIMNIILDAMN